MYGLTRGLMTLIGVAVAGGLIWLASWFGPRDSMTDYWIAMGLVAGAGLVMAVSQLLGGWTKWGAPRVSVPVLLLGFLPALVAGGWILVAAQPNTSGARDNVLGWSSDIGISWLVSDVTPIVGAVAFGLGLVFGLIFDTTGVRRRDVVEDGRYVDEDRDGYPDGAGYREREVAEEPVTAERRRGYDGDGANDRDRTYADGNRTYDQTDETVERPAREPVGVGTRDERATPAAPQPEPEAQPRRRSFFRR
jgi:hypothetical protein